MAKHTRALYISIALVAFTAIIFFFLSFWTYMHLTDTLLQEKVVEYERHLEIIADRYEYNKVILMDETTQEAQLMVTMAKIDEYDMTYAALYKYTETEGITEISRRTPSYVTPFNPMNYSNFEDAIINDFELRGTTHTIKVWFEADDVVGRDVYVSYRWIPKVYGDVSYLVVTGISQYTLQLSVPTCVYWVEGIELFILGLLCILGMYNINRLLEMRTKTYFDNVYYTTKGGDNCGV